MKKEPHIPLIVLIICWPFYTLFMLCLAWPIVYIVQVVRWGSWHTAWLYMTNQLWP